MGHDPELYDPVACSGSWPGYGHDPEYVAWPGSTTHNTNN